MPLKEALEQCVNMMVVRRMKGTQLVMTLNRSVWILQSFPYISCPSIMIDGNFCCDINKTFNYKFRWRKKKKIIIIIIIIITRCYQIIQSYKRSQPVNPNNRTTINTLSAAVITVTVDVQILPTGEEFGGRGGHFSIMQYPDKGHRS